MDRVRRLHVYTTPLSTCICHASAEAPPFNTFKTNNESGNPSVYDTRKPCAIKQRIFSRIYLFCREKDREDNRNGYFTSLK